MRLLGSLLVAAPRLVASLCECGYLAPSVQGDNGPWLFTDMLESDFTRVQDVSELKGWVPQQFDVSAKVGRGRYGKAFSPANIASHPRAKSGEDKADAAGVALRVASAVADGAVPVAEIDSAALDMYYGSYRAGMKLTAVHGTCSAFFWYFNDTQEIEMEFLSQDYDHEKQLYPVNLVIQSQKSMKAGYDASRTDSFKRVNLTFDPTDGFHEYRFDYLILQHWCNGDPKWSGGPPTQDALLTVSYVKAYFNTSSREGVSGWAQRCAKAKASAVCSIPDVLAGNASTGGRFFTDEGARGSGKDDGENSASSWRRVERRAVLVAGLAGLAMVLVDYPSL